MEPKKTFKYEGHNSIRLTSEGVSQIVKDSDEITLVGNELKQVESDNRFKEVGIKEKTTKPIKKVVEEDD